MYFVMNDHNVTDDSHIGIYIDELPIEFGYYSCFAVTCIETLESVVCSSVPTDRKKRTPTMMFDVNGNEQCQFKVEYMMIGDTDYTYLGTFVLSVSFSSIENKLLMSSVSSNSGMNTLYLPTGNGNRIDRIIEPIMIERG